jgi:hypothetical protein
MRFAISLAFVVLIFSAAQAANSVQRQLGPHEHGHGTLDIAVEGTKVSLELEVPGDDIAGFEHKPVTDPEKATLARVTDILNQPLTVFEVPQAASCRVTDSKVEIAPEKHASGEAEEPGEHSEFHNFYTLTCASPAALTSIHFRYFDLFERAQSLTVTIVTDKGQNQFDVTRQSPQLDLAALM